ncbi:MAG: N-acetyl sugar amidotransferase, partial [Thermoguttaceae bacterium]
ACVFEERKKKIDWDKRFHDLKDIAAEAKRKSSSVYDCVIGVSGGKDSLFQAIYAKEKLGMNPLLVNSVPDGITAIGRHNIENLAKWGFDIIQIRPDPNIARRLAIKCFTEKGNMVTYSEFALWVSAYIIAEKFDIPLVLQGENAAITLGTCSFQDITDDATNIVNLNTIKSVNIEALIDEGYPKEKLWIYSLERIEDAKRKGVRGVYLQYYAKEWSQVYNADFAIARGILGRTQEDLHDIGRYRRYTALDADITIANQMLKYLKLGFGFATDEACYDIREGRLTREDAVWLVKEYDGKCGEQYLQLAYDYMKMTPEQFWAIADIYVNKNLFKRGGTGEERWVPKFEVGIDFEEA